MNVLYKLKKLTFCRVFAHFARKYDFRWVPDMWYLKWSYKGNVGRRLNLANPWRFTEKLQWLKLYDRNPAYHVMVDKAAAKEWAASIIGREHIIPTLDVWERFDDIDFDALPDQFVLKCTHDSHSVIVCKNKKTLDLTKVKNQLSKALKRNYYYEGRQWPYKNVLPRIIAEQYMQDEDLGELRDYKFFAFNGEPKIMYIATGRGSGVTYGDFFDMDFQHLDLQIDHEMAPICPEKPRLFEEMKKAAFNLAKGIPQVRVDFYEVNGEYYFGEMTFFHCSGLVSFKPDEWDVELGSWIDLPM